MRHCAQNNYRVRPSGLSKNHLFGHISLKTKENATQLNITWKILPGHLIVCTLQIDKMLQNNKKI